MSQKLDCLKLINFIENSVEFKNYILPCNKLLIAYSGGQDSTVLLTIFYILSQKYKFKLGVVYCNHNWTKKIDNSLVVLKLIQNYQLPLYYVQIDLKKIQKSENSARQWRYEAFEKIIIQGNYDLLLTGHTLSDKAETILFNLIRGCGLGGINSLKTNQYFTTLKLKSTFKPTFFHFKYQILELGDFISYLNKFQRTKIYQTMFLNKQNCLNLFTFYVLQCYFQKIANYNFDTDAITQLENKKHDSYRSTVFNPTKTLHHTLIKNIPHCVSVITFINPATYLTAYKFFVACYNHQKFNFTRLKTLKKNLPIAYYYFKVWSLERQKLTRFKIKTYNVINKKLTALVIKKGSEKQTVYSSIKSNHNFYKVHTNLLFKVKKIQRTSLFNSKSFTQIQTNKQNYDINNTIIFTYPGLQKKKKKKYFHVVRPFLKIDRLSISLFVETLQLPIYVDSSNLNINFTRNFIRHKLMPLIKKINPKVEHHFYKFAQIATMYYESVGKYYITLEKKDFFKF